MYLEIAPRRSGKTLRLIKAAIEHYYITKETVSIIVCNSSTRDFIRNYVPNNINVYTYRRGGIYAGRGIRDKFFYDEFDLFPDSRVIYDENFYYSSSEERGYHFQNLKTLNNGKFRSYDIEGKYIDISTYYVPQNNEKEKDFLISLFERPL